MRLLLFLGALTLSGCTAQPSEEVSQAEGAALFADNCAMCHGDDARGAGPNAAGLSTAPPDLTKIADRRDGVWPMLEVMSIIDGYTREANPRDDMPVVSDLSEGPMLEFDTGNGQVTTAPARLVAVAEFLESIQSPRPERYVP